jgi:hypothetical protein
MNFLPNNSFKIILSLFFLISAPLYGMQNQKAVSAAEKNKVSFKLFIHLVNALTKINVTNANTLYQFVDSLPEREQDDFAKIYAKAALEGRQCSDCSSAPVQRTIAHLTKPLQPAFVEFFKKERYSNVPPCLIEKSILQQGFEKHLKNLSHVNHEEALKLLEQSEIEAAMLTLRHSSVEDMKIILAKYPQLTKKLNEQIIKLLS